MNTNKKLGTEKWLSKSLKDLENAKFSYKWKRFDMAAFYSQQSVEKALKALYIKSFGRLIKTHDLNQLGKELNMPQKIIRRCIALNRAYVITRYPDIEEEYSNKDIEEFLRTAEMVIK